MSNCNQHKGYRFPRKSPEYNYEIELVDETLSGVPSPTPSTQFERLATSGSIQSPRKKYDTSLYQHQSPFHLREEITRWKFAKYQDRGPADKHSSISDGRVKMHNGGEVEGREDECSHKKQGKGVSKLQGERKTITSEVDILYENQRGMFLCGIPLFSARALGNLDPAPWTNIAHKPSPTDTSNAQPPDPSWEWVGDNWSIYHFDNSDDNWKYSFAFHGNFSWHQGRWWDSFVRRRAWFRKRVKKKCRYNHSEPHILSSDYYMIYASQYQRGSRTSLQKSNDSYDTPLDRQESKPGSKEVVCDIGTLKKVLRMVRIDREITEAVESFIKNEKTDILCLIDQMHEIMRLFIFQASRYTLVALLWRVKNEAIEQRQVGRNKEIDEEEDSIEAIEALDAVLRAAQREIKNFEF